jgi:hypothetical protein
MKIRRSMVVLFIIASLIIPISLYRTMFSQNASEEFLSTVGVISGVLMTVFLLLVVAFSIFSDDYPHSYAPAKSAPLGLAAMLTAAACGYSSVLGLISDDLPIYAGVSGKIFVLIGLLSVLTLMFYSVSFFKGENLVLSFPVAPIFPALWYGYRMLSSFLRSASMADISAELPVLAMSCAFTIFLLTLGKLMCCINSNSIKWGYAAGCIGILTSMLYSVNWLVTQCTSVQDMMNNPLVFADIFMALFAVGALFHVSKPAQYFDDEEWDDYFYETYDLPKPNLILHTPVDELEEDSLLDDDIDDSPYIPVSSGVNGRRGQQGGYDQEDRRPRQQQPPAVPSYIANPAAYYPQYPQYQGYPNYPQFPQTGQPSQPSYYPQSYPSYPVYPYQGIMPPDVMATGADRRDTSRPVEYVSPYDAAAAQYQYERRRAELQSRELEKLTGEVDSSLARLQSNVARSQPPSNLRVNASPDEEMREGQSQPQQGRNVRLAQGERITDRVERMEQQNRRSESEPPVEEDEYTYEYYYPTDRSKYSPNQFNPTNGNQGGGR